MGIEPREEAIRGEREGRGGGAVTAMACYGAVVAHARMVNRLSGFERGKAGD